MQSMPEQFPPPPRRVPPSLVLANLFGGFAQFGWLFFGFGMIFVWAFVANADFSFVTFRGDLARVTGRVTHVDETAASEDDVPVVANHYAYTVAGEWHEGVSYTTGRSVGEGEPVPVEYKRGQPALSRIAGMRRAQFGPWPAFVVIFPLAGLAFIAGTARLGLRRNRLLRDGVLTTGTLIGREATNVTVNRREVYELTFEFTARDGRRCEATARTSQTERLQDEAREPLLYDPADPSRAYVLDEVPWRPQIDAMGELRGRPLAALLAVIIPLLVVAGHGLVLLMRLELVR